MEQPIARGVNIPAAIVADLEKMVADTIIDEVPVDEEEDEELSLSSTGLPSYIYNIDVLKEEDINGVVESDHDRQGLFLSMAAANMAARQEIGDRGSKTAISFKEELEYHEFQDWDGMETHWVSATGLKVEARVIRAQIPGLDPTGPGYRVKLTTTRPGGKPFIDEGALVETLDQANKAAAASWLQLATRQLINAAADRARPTVDSETLDREVEGLTEAERCFDREVEGSGGETVRVWVGRYN